MTPTLELPEEAALVLDFNKAATIHDRIEVKRRAATAGYRRLADAMLNYLLPSKGALELSNTEGGLIAPN
jgi:hypothetical protein